MVSLMIARRVLRWLRPYCSSLWVRLTAGHGTDDDQGLGSGRDRIGERGVRRFVGPILFAGEEAHEGAALVRDLVADGAAQHRIMGLEGVEHRALRHRTFDVEGHLALDMRQLAQMYGEDDADHDKVWTSTDSTGGRSRTMGAQLSPAS